MMAANAHYDAIILGSGQGGTPLAAAYAKAGKKAALIEKADIGGCCVNVGCTPTKTMVASGRAAYLTRRGADYGVHTPGGQDGKIEVDMKTVRQRKRDIVRQWRSGGESRTASAGVDILRGEGSFEEPKALLVKMKDGSQKKISAESIYINTGERPAKPKLKGLDKLDVDRVLDSTSIQELGEVPEHLMVLGGGYIGLEFGQLFRRLGAEVTIIQRSSQLLPREDPEIAASMLKILQEDGITVHLSTNATSTSPSSPDPIKLSIKFKDGAEQTISGSHLLSAAGRVPNTDELNLKAVGIATNSRGYVVGNERLETNVPGVYVLGDAKGPPAFTHISYDDYRIVLANVLNKSASPLTTTDRFVPYVCYTDPQMGHVGLHENEVRAKFPNKKIQTATMPMQYVARALETAEPRGLMKAVVDGETGKILGFSCLGLEGGEIMSIVQMAMMGGLRWEQLRDATFAHPALAESLNNLWGFLK
jgi:pyruvate/2-oxoglutarate dehydrogenase complex dihydrolipoamide dehydrogenase (E3) component